jgi:hypothetical protein
MTLTQRERRLIARLSTPLRVQLWLNELPYNTENGGETLRSFRPVARLETAHCLEAALFATVVMEQHGYPPLVMSLESQDNLDHVIFIYRERGRWGSVARSRDPGLHGRKAVFASPRALARSYIDPYVDYTGRVRAFGVCNLATAMRTYDWRLSEQNVWKVEQVLIDWPHRKLASSTPRYRRLKRWYREYRATHDDRKPTDYRGREKWTPIPEEFTACPERSRNQSR